MPQTIDALVDGGKASAGPPLGPALGPLGVNVADVITAINEKTKAFAGMQVPVKIIVNGKDVKIEVGTPPVTSLLKKELKTEKLATVNEDKTRKLAGNLSLVVIRKIAKGKEDVLSGDFTAKVKQVLGTCVSCGVTVDGRDPRDVIRDIAEGKAVVTDG